MDTEAIVNAANNDLVLGAGRCRSDSPQGREEIQRECDAIGSIPVGYAAITTGGKLKARFVIHAASMQLGEKTSAGSLRNSSAHSCGSPMNAGLSPSHFPLLARASPGSAEGMREIMIREAAQHLRGETSIETIYFVLFDEAAEGIFKRVWNKILAEPASDAAGAKGA